MKCLEKYSWLKLSRAYLPNGQGLMGHWAKLAAHAAFRKGIGMYCGHRNPVSAGMWSGGIVGLKSILGVKRRSQALKVMRELEELGYISFSLDSRTKKLSYQINDWVMKHTGGETTDGTVYATDGFGFFCTPRNITERLVQQNKVFGEADAWLDLWCHTVYRDYGNAFSFLGPAIQFGKYGSVLTMQNLGKRWQWEKTKVWRFFQKNAETFALYKLPSSYGCVIFNARYQSPDSNAVSLPTQDDVYGMLLEIRNASRAGIVAKSETERINYMVAWNSRKVVKAREAEEIRRANDTRVAPECTYTRAYFSHGRNCKNCRNCNYDCQGMSKGFQRNFEQGHDIRGPCTLESPFRTFMIGEVSYGKS